MQRGLYKVQTRYMFHCHIRIKIPDRNDDGVFDELYSVMADIDKKYNSYVPGSYFDIINRNAGNFTEVDDDTIDILKKIIFVSDFTDGLYDPTIMPLIRLWGFYKKRDRIPSSDEIRRSQAYVNYRNIKIEDNSVRIDKKQEIITGSFIKAYATDKLKEKIGSMGITDAVINVGGSTILAINVDKHKEWRVNVNHVDNKEKLFQIRISNQCYSTSEQSSFVEIEGQQFGHIINPKTGYPSMNKQIGLVTDDCITGDILSTALFNENKNGFTDKVKRLSKVLNMNIEGFMIDENNSVIFTPGFEKKYISKNVSL